jgi:hypothetical protein
MTLGHRIFMWGIYPAVPCTPQIFAEPVNRDLAVNAPAPAKSVSGLCWYY